MKGCDCMSNILGDFLTKAFEISEMYQLLFDTGLGIVRVGEDEFKIYNIGEDQSIKERLTEDDEEQVEVIKIDQIKALIEEIQRMSDEMQVFVSGIPIVLRGTDIFVGVLVLDEKTHMYAFVEVRLDEGEAG